jgi:hypothetical protein
MGAHDWVNFEEGRAQFSGGIRGWDEVGHQTFGVELDGLVLYGEVRKAFLPDDYSFNIQIISFGYFSKGDVAMPRPGQSSKTFSVTEAKKAESLILQLVAYTSELDESEERAFVMSVTETSHFMGKVFFSEDWIFISEDQFAETNP